jgi:hypothetical protein
VFIFTYHLLLGHVARWLGVSLDPVYHGARVLASELFLITAYHFIARFIEPVRQRVGVWLLFIFSSGAGWLALPTLTSDFWVSEAYPFLTLFSNAHFPLTWSSLLWLFEWTLPGLAMPGWRQWILVVWVITLQALIQPMVLLSVGLLVGGMVLGRWLISRRFHLKEWLTLGGVGLASLPWLLNAFFVTRASSQLAGWNAQNLTPSPPWWDALLSGGLPLGLALVGVVIAARRRTACDQVLLYWFGLSLLALYAPFALQRRLSLGLWMPMILLAVLGWREGLAPRLPARWRRPLVALAAILMLLTNSLVYLTTTFAVQERHPKLFLTTAEVVGLQWLAKHATGQVVLASPELGLFIPAQTDARVIYGHPFETAAAEVHEQAVLNFFTGKVSDPSTFLQAYAVRYIVAGPRERALGLSLTLPAGWKVVFQLGEVVIYGR